MRVTRQQLNYLKELREFFKTIPLWQINQTQGKISIHQKKPCGCFGAWITKRWFVPEDEIYHYEDGSKIFEKQMEDCLSGASNIRKEMEKIAGVDYLFSSSKWDFHPHTVLTRIIEKAEVIK